MISGEDLLWLGWRDVPLVKHMLGLGPEPSPTQEAESLGVVSDPGACSVHCRAPKTPEQLIMMNFVKLEWQK